MGFDKAAFLKRYRYEPSRAKKQKARRPYVDDKKRITLKVTGDVVFGLNGESYEVQ